jgi:hypothetical protein
MISSGARIGKGRLGCRLRHLANFEHFSTADGTSSRDGGTSIFQRDLFWIFHLAFLFTLDAVARHHLCFRARSCSIRI